MFITLEGPDGSGKTSQAKSLVAYLRQEGYSVMATREPGGSAIGEKIRHILSSLDNKSMHHRTETLLFCAARAQHVEETIRPCLARGEIVICDRYADSTLAYQGYGHGNDQGFLLSLLDYATGGLWPDLTLLLDIDAGQGLERRRQHGNWNRLDDYDVDFHCRVRQGYFRLVEKEPHRWVVVDADQSYDAVQLSLRQAVMDRLHRK